MVWYRPVALCTSCPLCILVRIWPAWWSIRACRHQKKEQYAFLYTVRFFILWDISLCDTHMHSHSCSSPSCHPLFSFPEAHLLSVSVVRQRDSRLWLAVCDCRGEGVGTNLAWVLPENAKSQTSLHSEYEGHVLKARLTYQFPLDLHEGQDLTCVYNFEHGATETKTIHIPRYCEFNRTYEHISIIPNVEIHINPFRYPKIQSSPSSFNWLFYRYLFSESLKPHDSSAKPLRWWTHHTPTDSPRKSSKPESISPSWRQCARVQPQL